MAFKLAAFAIIDCRCGSVASRPRRGPSFLRACVPRTESESFLVQGWLQVRTHATFFVAHPCVGPSPLLPRPLFIYSHFTNTQKENAKVTAGVSAHSAFLLCTSLAKHGPRRQMRLPIV